MNRARCSRRSETDRPCGIPSRGNTPPGRPQKTDPPPERERFGGGSSNIPKETAGMSRSGGCKRRRKQEAEAAGRSALRFFGSKSLIQIETERGEER